MTPKRGEGGSTWETLRWRETIYAISTSRASRFSTPSTTSRSSSLAQDRHDLLARRRVVPQARIVDRRAHPRELRVVRHELAQVARAEAARRGDEVDRLELERQ